MSKFTNFLDGVKTFFGKIKNKLVKGNWGENRVDTRMLLYFKHR